MKKRSKVATPPQDDLRPEYQFDYSTAQKNPYAARLAGKTVLVVLAPDVAAAFPTAASVNRALRSVMRLATVRKTSNRPSHRTATSSVRTARARRRR
jgi:hypothetical protein